MAALRSGVAGMCLHDSEGKQGRRNQVDPVCSRSAAASCGLVGDTSVRTVCLRRHCLRRAASAGRRRSWRGRASKPCAPWLHRHGLDEIPSLGERPRAFVHHVPPSRSTGSGPVSLPTPVSVGLCLSFLRKASTHVLQQVRRCLHPLALSRVEVQLDDPLHPVLSHHAWRAEIHALDPVLAL